MKLFRFVLIALTLGFGLPVAAPAAEIPSPLSITPNFTNALAGAQSVTNSGHLAFDIPAGKKILLIQGTVVGANAGTSNVTASINTTLDSTSDWTTGFPYTATWTLNGTNPVNMTLAITNPMGRFASIDKWQTTQTNAVTISNLRHTFMDY